MGQTHSCGLQRLVGWLGRGEDRLLMRETEQKHINVVWYCLLSFCNTNTKHPLPSTPADFKKTLSRLQIADAYSFLLKY